MLTQFFAVFRQFHFVAAFAIPLIAAGAERATGDAVIRAAAGGSEIVITTTARLTGAIHSLTWNGKEFIDSADHGRQLQSASNLDFGTPILNETFNPTEAGSRRDGAGNTSSSRLLDLHAERNVLATKSQMAFWLAPGELSGGQSAKNATILSEHLFSKRVCIGWKHLPNVISYDATFTLPTGERHTHGVFEAVTGYMPPGFERFAQFNPTTGVLEALSDGPGEIPRPIVFSTPDGRHAMGIYSPPQHAANTTGPTYGRFRFTSERVVKWNCVFRIREKDGIPPGDYAFHTFVVVGDVETVTESLRTLHGEFAPR